MSPSPLAFAAITLAIAGIPPVWAADDDDDAHAAEVRWLKEHAIRLKSIDPAEEDFADLEPLRASIGDARVVMLGEQSHGDGATFSAKIRLIKFLHQRMGFDVFAIEDDLYKVRWGWAATKESGEYEGLFWEVGAETWKRFEQMRPLAEYFGKTAGSGCPLEFCGFDCQPQGDPIPATLFAEFSGMLLGLGKDAPSTQTCLTAVQAMDGLIWQKEADPARRGRWRDALGAVGGALDGARDLPGLSEHDRLFWAQMMRSSLAGLEVNWGRFGTPEEQAA